MECLMIQISFFKILVTSICVLVITTTQAQTSNNLTFGVVQQIVVKGASKEKVIEALGSPNMITSTSDKGETWIYDKISTTVENQSDASSASIGGGVIGGIAGIFGSMGKSEATNKATSSQKTMTVIIKFKGDLIDSFNTRVTSF